MGVGKERAGVGKVLSVQRFPPSAGMVLPAPSVCCGNEVGGDGDLGQGNPKSAPQRATPEVVLAVAAAAGDIPSLAPGFVGTLILFCVCTGLSRMCATGGASAGHLPVPKVLSCPLA